MVIFKLGDIKTNAEPVAVNVTPSRSFKVSKGNLLYIAGAIANAFETDYKVYPSGFAVATTCVAILDPAPGRFSTTTD